MRKFTYLNSGTCTVKTLTRKDNFFQEKLQENELDVCLKIAKSVTDFIYVDTEDIADWL